MPTGITGIPRPRRWDATVTVEIPDLAGVDVDEVWLQALADGTVSAGSPEVPAAAPAALAAALDDALARPFQALAVRKGPLVWAVAGREVHSEPILLDADLQAEELEVAVAPDGERTAFVDGEPLLDEPPAELAAALAEVERLGRARFECFVARADRVEEDRWDLTIDPL